MMNPGIDSNLNNEKVGAGNTPWKMNGWFTYSHHPIKRKEHDLNQTFRELLFHVNLQGCKT